MTVTHTIIRDDVEHEVESEFQYHKGCAGHCDKYGAPEEPDEDPEMEHIQTTMDSVEIELTPKELEIAEELAWNKHSDL